MSNPREKIVKKTLAIDHEHIVIVLQGGGALGAYQAGVFEDISKFLRQAPASQTARVSR